VRTISVSQHTNALHKNLLRRLFESLPLGMRRASWLPIRAVHSGTSSPQKGYHTASSCGAATHTSNFGLLPKLANLLGNSCQLLS
jgi:hypothetical protein